MGRRSVNMSATYSDRSRVRAQEAQDVLLGSNKDRHDRITAGTLGLGNVSLTNVNNNLTINNATNVNMPNAVTLSIGSVTLTNTGTGLDIPHLRIDDGAENTPLINLDAPNKSIKLGYQDAHDLSCSIIIGNPNHQHTSAGVPIVPEDEDVIEFNGIVKFNTQIVSDGDASKNIFVNSENSSQQVTIGIAGGSLVVPGTSHFDGGIDVSGSKFTVGAAAGDVITLGTLGVTGLSSLDGGIDVNGAKFKVDDATGNVLTLGTLDSSGATSLATNGGVVNIASTGVMTTVKGTLNVDEAVILYSTLDVTGDTSVSTLYSSGATSLATGSGDVNIATSGAMTTVKGTLNVGQAVTLDTTLDVNNAITGTTITGTTINATSSFEGSIGLISQNSIVGSTIKANNLLTADGGLESTTISASGLVTANTGLESTTITASGLVTANTGLESTTINASGLIKANGGLESTTITATGSFEGAIGVNTPATIKGTTIDGTTITATGSFEGAIGVNTPATIKGTTIDGTTITATGSFEGAIGVNTPATIKGTTIDGTTITATSSVEAGTLTLTNGSITDSGSSISFGDENLTTTGTVTANSIDSGTLTGVVSITEGTPGVGINFFDANITTTGNIISTGTAHLSHIDIDPPGGHITGANNIGCNTLDAVQGVTCVGLDAGNGQVLCGSLDAGIGSIGGKLTTASQPNITSVGTLTDLTVTNTIAGSVNGSAATVTTASQPNITSVGTLTDLTVDNPIAGSITGNAGTATEIASITNSNIVQLAETQTLTNKSLTSPAINSGILTSVALVSSDIGTPSSGVLTNCTGTAVGLVAGSANTATTISPTTGAGTAGSASGLDLGTYGTSGQVYTITEIVDALKLAGILA